MYEALLSSPESSIRRIAELTSINRGSVLGSLHSLVGVGIVSYVQVGKRRKYIPQDPELFHELINERRRELAQSHAKLDTYIQQLGITRNDPVITRFASFYDGDEGAAAILRDVITTCRFGGITQYYAFSSTKVSEYMYNNFTRYTRERIRQGIEVKVIRQSPPLRNEGDLAEWKVLPVTHDPRTYQLIYADKVALISSDPYNRLSGVIINNKGIADVQRVLFEHTWQSIG